MADYNTDIKEYIERGLAEVGDLINRREYNPSVIKARQIAGTIVSGYASERNINSGKLADTIEALYTGGAISMTSRDDLHSLRLYGNKAVHDKDCTEEDARSAYYFLNNEVQTYLSRKNVSVDRTPVKIDRSQLSSGYDRAAASSSDTSDKSGANSESGHRSSSGTAARRRRSSSQGVRSARNSSKSGTSRTGSARKSSASSAAARKKKKQGFSAYDILKILIPAIIFILFIIIVRSLLPSGKSETEVTPAVETTASVTEPETEPETTTEAETEPPVYEYQIKGNNVNIRYADNQDRVYTQLSSGYYIGEVTEIEDSDFVQFTLDGVSVVVHKDYIEPVTED